MSKESVSWMLAEYTANPPPLNQAQQMGDGLLAGIVFGTALFVLAIISVLAYSFFSNVRDWVREQVWRFKYRSKK